MNDDAIHGSWLSAREQWPTVVVGEAAYRAFLAQKAEGRELADVASDDLYLTCACEAGDSTAIAVFEQTFFGEIEILLRKHRRPDLRDELQQQLRVKLFVPREEGATAIAAYVGRGPLRRWFRMVAARTMLNLLTRGTSETPVADDFLADMLGGDRDPELEYIKQSYRREFKRAFTACLSGLDEQQQSLLRAAFRDGVTVDAMATIHQVHRATVARWVVKAHKNLVKCIRARLMGELGMSPSELQSMFNLIFSRMELTLDARVER